MKKLYRSRKTKVLGGVAAGLAEYFNVDVTLMRLIFALTGIMAPHVMILGYILAWVIIPEEPFTAQFKTGGTDRVNLPNIGRETAAPSGAPNGIKETPAESGVSAGESSEKIELEGGLTADEILAQRGATDSNPSSQGQSVIPQNSSTFQGQGHPPKAEETRHSSNRSSQFFGVILVGVGAILLLKRLLPPFWLNIPSYAVRTFWPLALVVLGLVIVLTAIRRDEK